MASAKEHGQPARLHVLPARDKATAVVIRRKPSKNFQVIVWNTATGELTPGSRFRGKLFPLRCDVSFDGRWLTYLALGSTGETWNGLCELPWLKTIVDAPNMGTWRGGGYWASAKELRLNNWEPPLTAPRLPFRVTTYVSPHGEDEGVLYPRLERDGWLRHGPLGEMRVLANARKYTVECIDDAGWSNKPSARHPRLWMYYLGYLRHGRTFRFRLEQHEDLLDDAVQWACWDALGALLVARQGTIARYELADLPSGSPSFLMSLETAPLWPAA